MLQRASAFCNTGLRLAGGIKGKAVPIDRVRTRNAPCATESPKTAFAGTSLPLAVRRKHLLIDWHPQPVGAELDWEVQRGMWGEVKEGVEAAWA